MAAHGVGKREREAGFADTARAHQCQQSHRFVDQQRACTLQVSRSAN
jgi:hypothetical protein